MQCVFYSELIMMVPGKLRSDYGDYGRMLLGLPEKWSSSFVSDDSGVDRFSWKKKRSFLSVRDDRLIIEQRRYK